MINSPKYLLASRSPRRRELLALLVGADQIEVVAPLSADEPDFTGLTTWSAIQERLQAIADGKARQVLDQIGTLPAEATLISADTTIVVATGGTTTLGDASGTYLSLGQPPDGAGWQEVVRSWFLDHYAGRTHWAATALIVARHDGVMLNRVVTTAVTFRPDVATFLEWYLATEEPRGKAGGYALQGAGSLFVTRVEGSLSNVIGLPLEALRELLA